MRVVSQIPMKKNWIYYVCVCVKEGEKILIFLATTLMLYYKGESHLVVI